MALNPKLGITEEVVESTTFFYGSTAARRTNIQVAASRFNGLVIAPGEEFIRSIYGLGYKLEFPARDE